MAVDDLLHKALRIEDDLVPEADVEILERNGQHVLAVQRTQNVRRWRKSAVVADAVEIGTNIRTVGHTGLRFLVWLRT